MLAPRAAVLQALMPFKPPPDLSRFLLSPMPGLLVDVAVAPGQAVRAGERLAVIEAMKMENILVAAHAGVVARVVATRGASLAVDDVILEFESAGEPRERARDRSAVRGARHPAGGHRRAASKAALRALWVDLLGLEVTGTFRSERENVDEDICALGSGPTRVEVDLMEPIDPEGKPAVHATAAQPHRAVDRRPAGGRRLAERARCPLRARRHQEGRGRLRHLLPPSPGERRSSRSPARAC